MEKKAPQASEHRGSFDLLPATSPRVASNDDAWPISHQLKSASFQRSGQAREFNMSVALTLFQRQGFEVQFVHVCPFTPETAVQGGKNPPEVRSHLRPWLAAKRPSCHDELFGFPLNKQK